MLEPSEPGAVRVFDGDFSALETGQPGAHALSAVAAVQLLQVAYPELRDARFKLITVAIDSASIGLDLSPTLAAKLPQLLDQVLRELA
jgi:Ni,Fe-hydrogenase maturation factor